LIGDVGLLLTSELSHWLGLEASLNYEYFSFALRLMQCVVATTIAVKYQYVVVLMQLVVHSKYQVFPSPADPFCYELFKNSII
jgi:hypothetical protein